MRSLLSIVVCALLGVVAGARTASAQVGASTQADVDAEQERTAQQEFERGTSLYAARSLAEAVDAFVSSYRLVPTANLAFASRKPASCSNDARTPTTGIKPRSRSPDPSLSSARARARSRFCPAWRC